MLIFLASCFLLLGAAALGYLISRVRIDQQITDLRAEKTRSERSYSKLRADYDELTKESSKSRLDIQKLKQQQEANKNKLKFQKDLVRQLESDKEFIFSEYENFRNETKSKLEASQKIFDTIDSLKEKTQKEKIKTDKWRIKFHEASQELQNLETELRKLKKEKENLLEQSKLSTSASASLLEWESNYKELKLRYLALAKEKKELEAKLDDMQTYPGTIPDKKLQDSVLKKEIKRLKKENKLLAEKLEHSVKSNKTKNKTSIFDRIKSRVELIDSNRIGQAVERQKDDLKNLPGMSDSIEQRFNAAGIYKLKQLAAFTPDDEELFNEILELPDNTIQNELWVTNARKLVALIEDPQSILARIGNRKDAVDFSRIGKASKAKKDNLQQIKGIGPFIEKKLNALGIYRIEQIAFFNEDDIEEISEIIELSAGHIKSDDWVGQAKRMK